MQIDATYYDIEIFMFLCTCCSSASTKMRVARPLPAQNRSDSTSQGV